MRLKRREFLSASAAAAGMAAAGPLLAQTPSAPVSADLPRAAASPSASAYGAPTEVKKIEIINLRELEAAAQKVIPPGGFGYISSAAGDEWTKRENEAAFKRVTIEPRCLTGYDDADLTTTLLGTKVSMPIIVSVMGGHGLGHVTAEAGTAQGAHAAGTLFTAGSQSTAAAGRNRAGQPRAQVVSNLYACRSGPGQRPAAAGQDCGIPGRHFDG